MSYPKKACPQQKRGCVPVVISVRSRPSCFNTRPGCYKWSARIKRLHPAGSCFISLPQARHASVECSRSAPIRRVQHGLLQQPIVSSPSRRGDKDKQMAVWYTSSGLGTHVVNIIRVGNTIKIIKVPNHSTIPFCTFPSYTA